MSELADEPFDLGIDNLNDIDNSRPRPKDGEYPFVITKVEKKANKEQNGSNLVIEFTSEQAMTSTEEKTIQAGKFVISKYCPLQQKAGSEWDFKTGLADLQDGVEGTKQGSRPQFRPGTYQGRRVFLTLKNVPDKATGELSCEIRKIKPNQN